MSVATLDPDSTGNPDPALHQPEPDWTQQPDAYTWTPQ